MTVQSEGGSLKSIKAGWMQHNWRKVTDLPEPNEEWIVRDTDIDKDIVMSLVSNGIIHTVDKTRVHNNKTTVHVFKTDERAYELLENFTENPISLLSCCDGSWINNERGVDGVTCGNCGTVHDSDTE